MEVVIVASVTKVRERNLSRGEIVLAVKVVKDGGASRPLFPTCTSQGRLSLIGLVEIEIPDVHFDPRVSSSNAAKFLRSDTDELASMFESEIKFFADVTRGSRIRFRASDEESWQILRYDSIYDQIARWGDGEDWRKIDDCFISSFTENTN